VQGCYARIGFTAEDITRYKAGKEAVISIVPVVAPDQRVSVTMSLRGFTAAFDASSELTP
jgi:invasion protein IalB